MPGPFPGMDPYLEPPALFPGVHQAFITYAQATLNTLLPARYVADIGERLYIVQPERGIYPDVVIIEHPSARPPIEQGGPAPAAMVSETMDRTHCPRCTGTPARDPMAPPC
jgi:Protein of unknown function (DUF4058)